MNAHTTKDPVELWADGDSYEPPDCAPQRTLGERFAPATRVLTATPGAAAATTLAIIALVVGGLALRPVTVTGNDAHGQFIAHCGLGYYVFGHPNPTISQSCRDAYAGHATVALAAAIALAALGLIAVTVALQRSRSSSLPAAFISTITGSRLAASVAAVGLAALVVGLASLRTVPVDLRDQAGPLTAHCGLGYYLLGTDDTTVQSACHHAFAPHADLALACAVVLLCCMAAVAVRVRTAPQQVPTPTHTPGDEGPVAA